MIIGRQYTDYYLFYDTATESWADQTAFYFGLKGETKLIPIEGRDRKKYLGAIAVSAGLSFDTSWQFKRIVKFLIDELDKKYGTDGNALYQVVKVSQN